MKLHEARRRTMIPVPPWGALALEWRRERDAVRITRVILPGRASARAWERTVTKTSPAPAAPELKPVIAGLRAAMRGAAAEFPLGSLDGSCCSDFQRRILQRLQRVGRGQVVTYRQLAEDIGRPGAARAVARALAANPFPLILPCHRVVRSDGSLGGYQGGRRLKRTLLELEIASLAGPGPGVGASRGVADKRPGAGRQKKLF